MKIQDLAERFDYWMKRYNHGEDSHSQSFRNFITYDSEIRASGTTYDEYVSLAFFLNKNKEYSIEWVVPYKKYKSLCKEERPKPQLD